MPDNDSHSDDHHESDHGSSHHGSHFKREYLDMETDRYTNPIAVTFSKFLEGSTSMLHNFLLQFRGEPYAYYHRVYNRVPLIDECYLDDEICQREAEIQYHRDKLVESQIVRILRSRKTECIMWYGHDMNLNDRESLCAKEREDYEKACENYFIKYGDLGYSATAVEVYAKQKHRLIWERRYGKFQAPVSKAEDMIKSEDSMIHIIRNAFGRLGIPKHM